MPTSQASRPHAPIPPMPATQPPKGTDGPPSRPRAPVPPLPAPQPPKGTDGAPGPQAFPNFATMHVAQPNHLLKAYERNFMSKNPNFSAERAPAPDSLVRPPPSPTVYWVVTAGEQIGLCHNPEQIDLARILLLPKFSIVRFDDWAEAVAFYTQEYKDGNLGLIKFVDSGTSDQPIDVHSNVPTPVPPKKILRFAPPNQAPPAKPLGAQTRIRKAKGRKGPPPKRQVIMPSDSEDLYLPDPPAPRMEPPPRKNTPPPRVEVIDDSDDLDRLPQRAYPKAANANPNPVTPARPQKRPFPLAVPQAPEISPTLVERGSPASKANRPVKKARAISEPPLSDSLEHPGAGRFLQEDWAKRPLQPLVLIGPASGLPSVSPRPATDDDSELADDDPELPAYPFYSTQTRHRLLAKGKGKAEGSSKNV